MKLAILALGLIAVVFGGVASAKRMSPRAKVIEVSTSGGATLVVLDIGRDAGVTTQWTAWLVDAKGVRVTGGDITLLRCAARECTGKVQKTSDEVQKHRTVRLAPP